MNTLRSGRFYRVTGASGKTGDEVELTVEAYDEADAARLANRQGVFVSGCVSAGPDGSGWGASATSAASTAAATAAATTAAADSAPKLTFAETVARDPVVQRLLRAHPNLGFRVKRLNDEDRGYLGTLVGKQSGITYRDSAYMGDLMKQASQWE